MSPIFTAETIALGLIRWNESRGNYQAPPKNPPYATASGAYQFIKATWAMVAAKTGQGGQYEYAYQAPKAIQDLNALWLYRTFGANSSYSWKASGPYPSMEALNYVVGSTP